MWQEVEKRAFSSPFVHLLFISPLLLFSFSGFICLELTFLHENVIRMRMGKFY